MEVNTHNIIKKYVLQKLLDTRLYFIKEHTRITNFFEEIKRVKKILIILPIEKSEETLATEYLPHIRRVFGGAKISTLDISTLRRSDTNWFGVPNNLYLSNIQNENFDLLIDLNGHHDRLCAYLGALTAAPMRLHLALGKFDKIYNLQIRVPGHASLNARYETMLSYIARMREVPV
jgi:hypothetical protein